MTDTISDMFNRIKSSQAVLKETVMVPFSNLKYEIAKILEKDKELRIDNQYYLKNKKVDIDFDNISEFIISIKETLDRLDKDKIRECWRKSYKYSYNKI